MKNFTRNLNWFLMLGLPVSNLFWVGKDQDRTSKQLWKAENISIEDAILH